MKSVFDEGMLGRLTAKNRLAMSATSHFYTMSMTGTFEQPYFEVGGNRSVQHMNELLNDGHIAFFSLSRPLIREPDLINRWQSGDLAPAACISCNGCYRTGSECIFHLKKQHEGGCNK